MGTDVYVVADKVVKNPREDVNIQEGSASQAIALENQFLEALSLFICSLKYLRVTIFHDANRYGPLPEEVQDVHRYPPFIGHLLPSHIPAGNLALTDGARQNGAQPPRAREEVRCLSSIAGSVYISPIGPHAPVNEHPVIASDAGITEK